VLDTPLNRFHRLEAQVDSNHIDVQAEIASLRHVDAEAAHQRAQDRELLESFVALFCLQARRAGGSDLRDIRAAQIPCRRILQERGVE